MARNVEKGPGYYPRMIRNAESAAFAGVLVVVGIVLSGISVFSLLSRIFDLSLYSVPLAVVEAYREISYPIVELPLGLLWVPVDPLLKEVLALYLLVGGVTSRPLRAIYVAGKATDYGSSVFWSSFGRFGSLLDKSFNWTVEEYAHRVTWWRRPFFFLLAIPVMPLTIWLFVSKPFTMESGGGLGRYQTSSDQPLDMATFDVAHFDCRVVLGLQLYVSSFIALYLTVLTVLLSPPA